jgi:hypothetical protein
MKLSVATVDFIGFQIADGLFGAMFHTLGVTVTQVAQQRYTGFSIYLDAASRTTLHTQPAADACFLIQDQRVGPRITADGPLGAHLDAGSLGALGASHRHI